jgi:hypothetical protein
MLNLTLREIVAQDAPESGATVKYRFECGGLAEEVWFSASTRPLATGAEPFVPLALLPAMTRGFDIVIDSKISLRLLNNLMTIQEIFAGWDSALFRKAHVPATPASDIQTVRGPEVGCFFSGGVDSFYSLLKHQQEITTLILVHGFDMHLDQTPLFSAALANVREVARQFGKKVIEVRTNLRRFSDRYVGWGMNHGAGLASVGLLLSPLFSKFYVPASHTSAHLLPWGSHPLLDHLWSTEQTEFVHDGCEVGRAEKVAVLAKSDIAMGMLRVCWRNPDGAYNCGKCEKCLRTMINLYAAGALGRCKTLPATLDLKAVARTLIDNESTRSFARDNLRAVEARGDNPQLAKALQDCLDGRYHRGIWAWPSKIEDWIGRRRNKAKKWLRKRVPGGTKAPPP